MIEKKISKYNFKFIRAAVLVLIVISFWLTSLSLWSTVIYKKTLLLKIPTLRSEQLIYHKNFYNSLDRAIKKNPGKAEYYRQQADKLLLALESGLLEELQFTTDDIENKYLEAIRLNPADYSNHLQLGLFYQKQKNSKTERVLLNASKLYPTSFKIYLDLSNYYYSNNENQKGFYSTMRCFNQAFRKGSFSALSKVSIETQRQIQKADNISFISGENAVVYTAYPKDSRIDLKKEGFPQVQIPILIKVYLKDPYALALLYRGSREVAEFILKEKTPEFNIYEFLLKDFSLNTYLNDYNIKTDDGSNIYRIDYLTFLEPVI